MKAGEHRTGQIGGTMFTRILAPLAFVFCCSISYAEEPVTIPLGEILGYHLLGTRDVRKLESKPENYNNLTVEEIHSSSVVHQIVRLLNSTAPGDHRESAGPAFVVEGRGLNAIRKAYSVLSGKKARSERLPPGKKLSLVFYSYAFSRYVRLDKVCIREDELTIDYHFEAHNSLNRSSHFALVPLDGLPTGEFRVSVNQLPSVGPA